MDALIPAAEFNVETYLLQIPGGYGLLDMLVQANVNLNTLSQEQLDGMAQSPHGSRKPHPRCHAARVRCISRM